MDYKKNFGSLEEAPISEEAKKIAEERGYWYEELEDHALMAVYREGSKWVYVERPPLTKVIKNVRERLNAEPSIVVDSGNGYHIYFKLEYEIDARKLRRLEEKLVDVLGGDSQSKDLARILRLPGSTNPRVNRPVKIIYESLAELDPEEIKKRLEELATQLTRTMATSTISITGARPVKLRLLKDSEILKVKELLKIIYKPGQRQLLSLYLAGWSAHSKIHPVSIAQIIKMLHDETNDDDKLEQRLSTIPYTYKKAMVWNEQVEKEFLTWLNLIGVEKIYGLSSHIAEEAVKGRGGIYELLVQTLGNNEEAEARANEILRQLSKIFSHGRFELICELIDYEKQLYVCAHFGKKIVARMRRKEDKLVLKEKVFPIVPSKVTLYIDPVSSTRRFELEIVGDERILPKPVRVGPAEPPDLVAWLRARGLCYHSRLAEDALNAVLSAFLRRQIAEVREEIDKPGFYQVDNRVIAVRYDPSEIDKKELREPLELLNQLAEKWYGHVQDKFAIIIKWGVVSPFIYAMKQRGKWVPWLYLYGSSFTGKTTLGEIILSIWDLGVDYRKSGAHIDTIPRLGHVISQSTFPVLVNEVGSAILREDVIEMMKNAVESTIARGKYVKGTYKDYPSLAPLIMTSNKMLPKDDALLRRLLVVSFTFGERIDYEKARKFEKNVKPHLQKLRFLGYYVAKRIIDNPNLLDLNWRELAEKLLEEAYREAELQIPSWIRLGIEHNPMRIYEDLRENVRNYLVKRINEEYNRFVGRIEVVEQVDEEDGVLERRRYLPRYDTTFRERVRIVLENNLLPWAVLKGDKILVTTGILEEIRKIIGDIGGLKSLAELLGWEYRRKVSLRMGKKVTSIAAAIVALNELIEFLQPEEMVTMIFYLKQDEANSVEA